LDPRLDLFAWIRAHDMLDLRFLPYGTCQYHHKPGTTENVSVATKEGVRPGDKETV
jgi:hypothetical protein